MVAIGRDGQVHAIDGPEQYTVFRCGTLTGMAFDDDYRPEANYGFYVNTFLRQYREGGLLPVWELSANETECMIGYHAVPADCRCRREGYRRFDRMQAPDGHA